MMNANFIHKRIKLKCKKKEKDFRLFCLLLVLVDVPVIVTYYLFNRFCLTILIDRKFIL